MRLLLAVVTILIVYGSLYPFGVDVRQYRPELLDALLDFSLTNSGRGDVIENVLLFVPFGFLAIRVFPPGRRFSLRLLLVLLVAFLLAVALQAAQLIIPGRVPAGSDAVWNLLGGGVGCFLGRLQLDVRLRRMLGLDAPPDIPVLLALGWLIYGFAPFVPSIDWQLWKDHVRELLGGTFNLVWVAQAAVMWLVVFRFLKRSAIPALNQKYYPVILAVTLASGFVMVGQTVSLDKFAGGLLALVIWFAAGTRIGPGLLAGMLAMTIVGINFTPFELRDHAASFSWIPFSGALTGNIFVNVLAIFKKLVVYGSLIWLMTEMRLGLRVATVNAAVFLFVNEYLQVFFVNTTPEITDALLALAIGAAFHRYTRWREGSPRKDEYVHSVGDGSDYRSLATDVGKAVDTGRSQAQTHYVPGMDGLRAIAALAVFLVHFNQQARLQAELGPFDLARWLANGNSGVALFFVLSGFLLATPFWRQQYAAGAPLDVKQYFLRRLARILPAYYLCLGGLLAVKLAAGGFPSINNVLSHVLFLYNVSDHNILSLNEPFWTLAVEMQFYLLLPVLMWGLLRCNRTAAFLWVAGLAVAAYLLNYGLVSYLLARNEWPIHFTLIWPFSVYISGPRSFVLTYSTLGHLTYFFIGMATALLYVVRPERSRRASSAVSDLLFWTCALFVFLILSTPLDDVLQAPYGHYNWPVVPLLLAVMVFVAPQATFARAILESRVLRGIGIVSYGVYIFHYPIQKLVGRGLRLVGYSVEENWLLFGIVSLVAAISIAAISYLLVERPIMRWARHHRSATATATATASDGARAAAARSEEVRVRSHDQGAAATSVGNDWIHMSVRLRPTQLLKLHRIADREGGSVSAAARHLLADFMTELGDIAGLRQGRAVALAAGAGAADVSATEDCRINLRRSQHDSLVSIAQRSGISVGELVAAVIERQSANR